jgi:PAS domain S-box-containing protein
MAGSGPLQRVVAIVLAVAAIGVPLLLWRAGLASAPVALSLALALGVATLAVGAALRAAARARADASAAQSLRAAALDAAFDSMVVLDADGRVTDLNARAEATFGYGRDEALGRRVNELFLPRYAAESTRSPGGERIELEARHADGSIFPVEMSITAHGGVLVASLRDLRERQEVGRALADSERRYRAVVEDQTELIVRCDADLRVTFANRAYARAFGAQPEALIGADFFHTTPPDRRESVLEELLTLTPRRPIRTGEYQETLADGATRWFAWTDRALFDADGRRLGYQSVGRDITEARSAEQALRQSEARFFGAAESLPDGLVILDADDRIAFYNSRHRDLVPPPLQKGLRVGVRFPDWIREGVARGQVYHPDMGADYADRRLASRGGPMTEREHKHADGRWVRIREGRMPDGGRVLLTLDITARKEAEEALRRSEARYRAVVEGQTEFILRLRPDGVLSFVNDAYCRYRAKPREALLASIDDLSQYAPEQQAQIRGTWASLTPGAPTAAYELEIRRPDSVRWEEWNDTGVFDADGRLVEIQSVGRDVTERKQAEAELRRQRELAHQREKLASLGSLLAGVAHELNNPLSVVVGRAILLEEQVRDTEVGESLGKIRAAAERCVRIVRSFLALARNQPREAARPTDIARVLDGVLDLAYGLRSAGVEVVREDGAGVPHALADADQLTQVFLNLIVNAQQALEARPPPRRLWLRTGSDAERVRVEVSDNGPGVPVELRDRVLEPFFTTKPVGAGTGLGLSVCHGILEAYDGTIEIDDRPGGGARFTVTLPAAAAVATWPAEAPAVATGPGGAVLVVDDEPEVAGMLGEVLTRAGHHVVIAAGGREALSLLRGRPFDAVLCDLRMPDLDGPGLLAALAEERPELTDRVLLMTGDALRASGVVPPGQLERLLEKPLDPAEVRRRVAEVVERTRALG